VIQSDLLAPRVEVENDNLYTLEGFLSTVKVFAEGTVQGVYMYVGHDSNRNFRRRGLVNVAAFLAHVKTVAVHDRMCDERNVDGIEKKYPLSNSCGQFGQTYQNLRCSATESFMECPPDPGMQVSAVAVSSKSDGGGTSTASDAKNGPPEFFCGPRLYFPFTGYYDGETSTVMNEEPFANRGESLAGLPP